MSKTVFYLFVIAVTSVADSFAQNNVPVKHALVVGISNYAPTSGFRKIDADNDLKIVMKLLRQQGFTDTIVLRDSQASKEGFTEAFRKLRSNVHKGDIVYIHFSTHGQQLQDLNGDEADGMDEAIALYDAQTTSSDTYKGQNHLNDDEFGILIGQLRRNLGKDGDVLVMVDACHSGSMSRGIDTAIIRGGYTPILLTGVANVSQTRGGEQILAAKRGNNYDVPDRKPVGMFSQSGQEKGGDLANYVIFSACENNEVSSEYCYNRNYFGPLTWAFLNAVLHNTSEEYTYNMLFHDIQYEMISMFENYKTKQNPTVGSAENSGMNRVIFGGRNVVQERFFTISKCNSPDEIIMEGGILSGIFDSTTVLVYPSGTLEPGKAGSPVTTGVVTRTGYMESVVDLDSALDDKNPGDYWIFIAERKYSDYRIKLGIGSFQDPGLKKKVLDELKQCDYAGITKDNPSYILEQKMNVAGEMILKRAPGGKIYKDGISPATLGKTLLNLARVQFLKDLQISSPGIEMEVSFKPADTLRYPGKEFINKVTMRNTVRAGADTAVLWIVNTGEKSFYFNIIDIDPEDNFSVILPDLSRPASECYLQPGQKFHASNTFSKPYGTEMLKIIASEKKFDLRPLINSTDRARGIQGDLEKMFSDAYTMRGAPSLPDAAELSTFNFLFDVIK